MAECRIRYTCDCACGRLSGSVEYNGETYQGVADPDTVREAGEFKFETQGTDEDPRCDCYYTGEVELFKDGDPELESIIVVVTATVHDNNRLFLKAVVEEADEYRWFGGTVTWSYAYPCQDLFFPPIDEGGNNYVGVPSLDHAATLEKIDDFDSTMVIYFGGDECCKLQCVSRMEVDGDWVYYRGHLTHCTEGGAVCPTIGVEPWPWARPGARPLDPAEYWDAAETIQKYEHFRIDRPSVWVESEIPNYCEPDCCSLFTVEDWNTNILSHAEDWWAVVSKDGWSTTRPSNCPDPDNPEDPATIYCFDWCDVKWYSCQDVGPEHEDFEFPTFQLTIPCGGEGNCLLYGVIYGDPDVEQLIEGADREVHYNEFPLSAGTTYYYGRFKATRHRFVYDEETGELLCDENNLPLTEEYEHICVDEVSLQAPSPAITDICGAWYCVESIPACADDECGIFITMSWTGPDECKAFGNTWGTASPPVGAQIWKNGETRLVCSTAWRQAAPLACRRTTHVNPGSYSSGAEIYRNGGESVDFFDCPPKNTCLHFKATEGGILRWWGDGNGNRTWSGRSPLVAFAEVKFMHALGGDQRSFMGVLSLSGDCGPWGAGCLYPGCSSMYCNNSTYLGAPHHLKIDCAAPIINRGRWVDANPGSVYYTASIAGGGTETITMSWSELIRGSNPPVANPP